MSAAELRLGGLRFELKNETNLKFKVTVTYGMNTISNELDRAQAHFLMLYLQEHLGCLKASE